MFIGTIPMKNEQTTSNNLDIQQIFSKANISSTLKNAESKSDELNLKTRFTLKEHNSRWVLGCETFFKDRITGAEKSEYMEDYLETMFHWNPKLSMHENSKENLAKTGTIKNAFLLLTNDFNLSVEDQMKLRDYICTWRGSAQYLPIN